MDLPLKDTHTLVTREKSQAIAFSKQIETYGGRAYIADLLKIKCLKNVENDYIYRNITEFKWIFFTSANGVHCFFKGLKHGQHTDLSHHKFAVVGHKTAASLRQHGYTADFIPKVYNAQTMATEFLEEYQHSEQILLVRGRLASPVLVDVFTEAGKKFECIEVYDTSINEASKVQLNDILSTNPLDFITFTSPSSVDAFVKLAVGDATLEKAAIVCIGTTTKRRALECGFSDILVPDKFTMEGMLEKMCTYHSEKESV